MVRDSTAAPALSAINLWGIRPRRSFGFCGIVACCSDTSARVPAFLHASRAGPSGIDGKACSDIPADGHPSPRLGSYGWRLRASQPAQNEQPSQHPLPVLSGSLRAPIGKGDKNRELCSCSSEDRQDGDCRVAHSMHDNPRSREKNHQHKKCRAHALPSDGRQTDAESSRLEPWFLIHRNISTVALRQDVAEATLAYRSSGTSRKSSGRGRERYST